MRKHLFYCCIGLLSAAIALIFPEVSRAGGRAQEASLQASAGSASAQALKAYYRLPLYFIANRGQVNKKAVFYETGAEHATFFTRKGIVVSLRHGAGKTTKARRCDLRIGMAGMNKEVRIVAEDAQPGKVNYFIGNDPHQWHADIPTYRAVVYKNAYPGIDLKFYGNNRRLEYDVIVKPGADPSRVRFTYSGARDVHVTAAGDLAVELGESRLLMKKPEIYQDIHGRRVSRQGKFEVRQDKPAGARPCTFTCRFDVGAYDRKAPLVIDPVLNYSTYLGGSGADSACAIAVDGSDNLYITGQTSSLNFPDASKSATGGGDCDAFITKIAAGGQSLVYSTYLGGGNVDTAFGIAVDSAGNAYVAGQTESANFPTTSKAFQTVLGGQANCFVTEIAANGQSLIYSTYLGGNGYDSANSIVVDGYGHAYVTGESLSARFPTTQGSFQPTYKGGTNTGDAFVTELAPGGQSLVYSTYLGGSGDDAANSIALDTSGNAYVAGWTLSSDFPVTSSVFQPTYKGGAGHKEAFVAKIAAGGRSLLYSTYLGGSGDDVAFGIAVDGAGDAYVTGSTGSKDFPVMKPLYAKLNGTQDAFVTEISPAGQSLVYSTYLGGSAADWGTGIAVDSSGNAFVVGSTLSTDFPARNAFQPDFVKGPNYGDAFVTELTAGGQNLAYSTYLGGSGDDRALGIALDSSDNAFVTGDTNSANFPTMNALQTAYGGSGDAFVAQIVNPWKNATVCDSTWMWQKGLGYFATTRGPVIFQVGLGWLYPLATSTNSIWYWDYQWDGKGGWLWTNTSFYPWVYSATEQKWLYYGGNDANGNRLFFSGTKRASKH